MIKKIKAGSFQSQAEEIIREEALKIAKATQTPGQSKEQTKQIARGIAKGIAEYKKHEKDKQRERSRLQKKRRAAENTAVKKNPNPEPAAEPSSGGSNRLSGLTAAGIFLLAGLLHLYRLVMGTEITIGTFSVPLYWSGVAAMVALLLAIWIYRTTNQAAVREIRRK